MKRINVSDGEGGAMVKVVRGRGGINMVMRVTEEHTCKGYDECETVGRYDEGDGEGGEGTGGEGRRAQRGG